MPPEERDDVFMRDPNQWPMFPFLPIKRYIGERRELECAVIHCGTLNGPLPEPVTVILTTLYGMDLKNSERKTYDTVDAVLADGWMVD
jgi:hypothetical protein